MGEPGREPSPVLQVVTSTDRRGAEVAAVQLGEALGAVGRQVETVALWPGSGSARLDVVALGRRRRDPRAVWALRRRARTRSVVVGHGSSTLPFGAAATTGTGVPFVYRSIGDPTFWADRRSRRLRVAVALRRARAVVALWPGAAESITEWFGVAPERIAVIPTAVEAGRLGPTAPTDRPAARAALGPALDPGRPTLALVGALSWEKNPLAAVELLGSLGDAQLLVAGGGPLAAELAERAGQVAPGRVHQLGVVDDVAPVLAAADVLVLPSRTEGIPAVAVEAALCGLPVVAARVGGVAEVVVDGETGVLVDAPTPFRLAQAVGAALARGPQMGAAGRARALDRFTVEAVARRWEDLLDGIIGP